VTKTIRCPNCGRKSEGDFCQWCRYPLLGGRPPGLGEVERAADAEARKQVMDERKMAERKARELAKRKTREAKEAKDKEKQEAKEVRELARREAKEAKEAEEKARREAKEAEEREKWEAEEAKKRAKLEAREAKGKAKREAREAKEKEKRGAEEAREKVKREVKQAKYEARTEVKEAKKTKNAKPAREKTKKAKPARGKTKKAKSAREKPEKEVALTGDVRLYRENVILNIASPIDITQLEVFEQALSEIENLRVVMVSGAIDDSIQVLVYVGAPLALISTLRKIPVVDEVAKRDNDIKVKLKSS